MTLHLAVLLFLDFAVIVTSPIPIAETTACPLVGVTDTIFGLEEVQVMVLSSVVSAGVKLTVSVPVEGRSFNPPLITSGLYRVISLLSSIML